MKKKAFTLIELLVIIAIIGLLMAMLIPAMNAARKAINEEEVVQETKQDGDVVEVVDNIAVISTGRVFLIKLKPSIVSIEEIEVFIKGQVEGMSLQKYGNGHCIMWEPTEMGKYKVSVISVSGSMKDKQDIVIEVY